MLRDFHSLSPAESNKHVEKWGHYNDLPAGWREISPQDFARSDFFTYSADIFEYRQMLVAANVPMLSARLFFMSDGTGYAISNDYWESAIHYYAFGCKHEFVGGVAEAERRGIRLFMHDHASFCPRCNYLRIVDSSD